MNHFFDSLDFAFLNGSVITVDPDDRIAQAAGVAGNRIVIVGSDQDVKPFIDERTKVIDLHGRTLMPGINDTHYHPILNGMQGDELDSAMINTGVERCRNIPELLKLVHDAAREKRPGEWISMMGYEASLLEERRHPTLEELDEAAPENPVQCMTRNGHISMYNSKALAFLDVFGPEDAKKYPQDTVEVLDGKLTGLVRGHVHFYLWGKVTYTEEQQKKAALKSQQQCLENGITSVGDMGECDAPSYHIMQKLCRSGDFRIRTNMALHSIFGKEYSMKDNDAWLSLGLISGLGDEHFRIGPSKFMIDGGCGGPSCATREPYSHDPSLARERGWEREETWEYIQKIDAAECQCTAHAIGDEAVEFMVEGYERAFAACADKEAFRDRRHRIEHCTLTDQDLIDRMAVMNICPSVNAGLPFQNGANLERFFGPERSRYLGAVKSMMKAGIRCSIHSDAPSGPVGLNMIDGAVNRYDVNRGYQCDRTQALDVLDAIRCATWNGAYSTHEEDIKGSIEAGKLADLIVLSDDILSIDPRKIHELHVDLTMIDGVVEYERT